MDRTETAKRNSDLARECFTTGTYRKRTRDSKGNPIQICKLYDTDDYVTCPFARPLKRIKVKDKEAYVCWNRRR